MRTLLTVIALPVLSMIGGCSGCNSSTPIIGPTTPDFRNFAAKEDRFKVWLPGEPKRKAESLSTTYQWESSKAHPGSYIIVATRLSKPHYRSPESDAIYLKDFTKDYLETFSLERDDEKRFSDGDLVKLEVTGKLKDTKEHLRVQTVLAGDQQYYHLMALGVPEFVQAPETQKFFESFQFVP